MTPLELFFDLCFVVAVGQVAERLHQSESAGRVVHTLVNYVAVFFLIWWAWMNFSWFASAYNPDDDVFRLTSLVQIAGGLVLAVGVSPAFEKGDFTILTYGYVSMRLALIGQWLRAARSDPKWRHPALRFAVGSAIVQAGWLGRLVLPGGWFAAGFVVLAAADLLVPAWAQRATRISWHPHHITDRCGQFTIIVLGESVLMTALAVRAGLNEADISFTLLAFSACSLTVVMAMWWVYFEQHSYHPPRSRRVAVFWGYGHYLIFGSAAAVGAGLAFAIDNETHMRHRADLAAGYAMAVPIAVYLLTVWALYIYPRQRGVLAAAFPITAALVLLSPFAMQPVRAPALLLVALVAILVITSRRRPKLFGRTSNKAVI